MIGEASGSVSVDVERISLGGKEHRVQTGHGSVSVVVFGDHDKPALVTYPDVAMNHMCFQGLFFSPQAASLLLHNFCIYHICPPGHESGAAAISADVAIPSVDDLADQVADVLDFFCIGAAMCLGVTAGAYILSLFAMKHRERVIGLVLVSPLCKSPSWTEWLYNKACGSLLDEKQNINVLRFLQAINGRHDIADSLKDLHCRTLIFVGENSPFHSEALYMASKLDKRYCALVEVQACGSVVTEEQPDAMAVPLEYFLMGYGLYKPYQWTTTSPRSPLSLSCISPELLSPESMGLKLKPIKTRVYAGKQPGNKSSALIF